MFGFVAPQHTPDDTQLMRRIAQGDADALAVLYQRDAARVYRYCMAMAHDESLAADAVQDTFVSLATQGLRPDGQPKSGFDASKGSLQGYLMGVARHHLLAALRHAGRYLSQDSVGSNRGDDSDAREPWESATDAHHALNPLAQQLERQDVAALMAAVAQLPFVFREAVVLVDLQESNYEDAARLAGVPLNTLRTRLHRGRARLAKALGAGGAKLLPNPSSIPP